MDSSVSSPLIGVDGGIWLDMCLNDRQKSGHISALYQFHIPQSWLMGRINKPKYPLLSVGSSAPVILKVD